MKAGVIAGVILIAIGIYVVAGQASYKTDREVLKIGGLEASVKESHLVPPVGGCDRDRGAGRSGVCGHEVQEGVGARAAWSQTGAPGVVPSTEGQARMLGSALVYSALVLTCVGTRGGDPSGAARAPRHEVARAGAGGRGPLPRDGRPPAAGVRVADGGGHDAARPGRAGVAVQRSAHDADRRAARPRVRRHQAGPRGRDPPLPHADVDPPRRTSAPAEHHERRIARLAARRRHEGGLHLARRRSPARDRRRHGRRRAGRLSPRDDHAGVCSRRRRRDSRSPR